MLVQPKSRSCGSPNACALREIRQFPEDPWILEKGDEAFGEWLGYNRALLPRLDSAYGDGSGVGAIRASRDLDSLW